MKRTGANISLKSYDEIFSTEEMRQDTGEHIIMVRLDKIHPFKNHPFKVVDDEDMRKTADSIREYGVLVPAIVRPMGNGEYEMISGHRRIGTLISIFINDQSSSWQIFLFIHYRRCTSR